MISSKRVRAVAIALSAAFLVSVASVQGQQAAVTDGAVYTASGELVRPANYREWIFLSSGLAMTYGPLRETIGAQAPFNNVFVNPSSYRAFMKSGRWPEQTIFVLEVRRAEVNASINNGGRTQGEIIGLEAEVKDSARFAATGGWAFFPLGSGADAAASVAPIADRAEVPEINNCYTCHRNNTAVENNFVQFYPELFAVARKMGTVKATFDPSHKVASTP